MSTSRAQLRYIHHAYIHLFQTPTLTLLRFWKKKEEKEEKGKIPIDRSSSRLIDFHSIAIDSNF